jgi:ribose transport system substrate-binding protein
VRSITDRGIPVIDIDTRLADDLDALGVASYLEPDNVWMAEQVTIAIIEAVQSDNFAMIHTQGLLTHTGAQGRAQGFRNVLARYPNIRVVDDSPADWDIDQVTTLWDRLLEEYPDVQAGFLHNDEMALAALRSISRARKQGQIVLGGIDGLPPACGAVARGDLVATAINPTGRIHGGALWVGYFLATEGDRADVPRFMRIDGGVVNKENAAGYLWLGDHLLI